MFEVRIHGRGGQDVVPATDLAQRHIPAERTICVCECPAGAIMMTPEQI